MGTSQCLLFSQQDFLKDWKNIYPCHKRQLHSAKQSQSFCHRTWSTGELFVQLAPELLSQDKWITCPTSRKCHENYRQRLIDTTGNEVFTGNEEILRVSIGKVSGQCNADAQLQIPVNYFSHFCVFGSVQSSWSANVCHTGFSSFWLRSSSCSHSSLSAFLQLSQFHLSTLQRSL